MSSYRPGAIVWREILSNDLAGTTAFYTGLFGWTAEDVPMGPGFTYRLFKAGDAQVAGGMAITPEMGPMPTSWMQYISVPDVDAAAEKAKELGATVMHGPGDIPNVGRFALLQDPQGAFVNVYKDVSGDRDPGVPAPGTFAWESLSSTDRPGSLAFYRALVGYEVADFHGASVLSTGAQQGGVADVGDAPPGSPSYWMSHVVVPNLEAARARAQELGATVMVPEIPIPETGRVAIVQDPQGAFISLFEMVPRG